MRIAVVSSSYPKSEDDPSGHFVRAEVNELVEQGHHVTVLCPGALNGTQSASNPKILQLGAAGLFGWPGALARVRARPWAIWQLLPFICRARDRLSKGCYDRVVVHWLVPCGWPLLATNSQPTEIVVHGSDARLIALLPTWLRESLLLSLRDNGHSLRFVAAHLKALIATPRTLAWITQSRVAACPIHVPALPDKAVARHALQLEGFVALVIGRLVPSKRVEVALERAVLPSGAKIYVIGSGPCMDGLRSRFPTVVFLGQLPRSQTLLWLQAADVLLNASRTEGAPTVVREARALNVPVWAAPCDEVLAWASTDPGIRIQFEFL